jgi:hypothetical protein
MPYPATMILLINGNDFLIPSTDTSPNHESRYFYLFYCIHERETILCHFCFTVYAKHLMLTGKGIYDA